MFKFQTIKKDFRHVIPGAPNLSPLGLRADLSPGQVFLLQAI